MPLTITTEESGDLKFSIAPGQHFLQPAADDSIRSLEPAIFMHGAASNIADAADEVLKVQGDENLSATGRERKLAPLRTAAVELLAQTWSGFANYEAHIEKREAQLFALPGLDPTHTAAAIEDREVRDWWRALPTETRAKLLHKVDNEPGHERLMIALLRSPLAMMQLDHEVTFVQAVWRRTARLNNPAEAEAIDSGRQAIEWARRGAAQLAYVGMRVIGGERASILETLVASKEERVRRGFGAFGFGEVDFERQRRVHEHRSRKAA